MQAQGAGEVETGVNSCLSRGQNASYCWSRCTVFPEAFLTLWTLKVAQGGMLFGKWMWKREITLERVGEGQKQAQASGGGGRKARDSAGTRAGVDMGWPNTNQLSSAWG